MNKNVNICMYTNTQKHKHTQCVYTQTPPPRNINIPQEHSTFHVHSGYSYGVVQLLGHYI